jgi:hypothetical protein
MPKDQQTTFSWSEELPAKVSQLPACERVSMTLAEDSCLPFLRSLNATDLDGLSGKMCPASCQATEDGILVPSSGRWGTWGMGGPTACWTLSGSEWPSVVGVCSLSDVLETSDVQQRYFLSQRACAGILHRAERRGKKLPDQLRDALTAVAQTGLEERRTTQTP